VWQAHRRRVDAAAPVHREGSGAGNGAAQRGISARSFREVERGGRQAGSAHGGAAQRGFATESGIVTRVRWFAVPWVVCALCVCFHWGCASRHTVASKTEPPQVQPTENSAPEE